MSPWSICVKLLFFRLFWQFHVAIALHHANQLQLVASWMQPVFSTVNSNGPTASCWRHVMLLNLDNFHSIKSAQKSNGHELLIMTDNEEDKEQEDCQLHWTNCGTSCRPDCYHCYHLILWLRFFKFQVFKWGRALISSPRRLRPQVGPSAIPNELQLILDTRYELL